MREQTQVRAYLFLLPFWAVVLSTNLLVRDTILFTACNGAHAQHLLALYREREPND